MKTAKKIRVWTELPDIINKLDHIINRDTESENGQKWMRS